MRAVAVALFLLGLLCLAQSPRADMMLTGVGGGPVKTAVGLSIDGSVANCVLVSGTQATAVLSTTLTNDIIIAVAASNTGNPAASTPMQDTSSLSWTLRSHNVSGANIAVYWALAASALASDTLTYTNNASATLVGLMVFAVHGANTSSPFDPNGGLPAQAPSGDASVNTTNANTVVYAGYSMSSQANPTAGAGFTGVAKAGCFEITEYKVVSSTQSALDMALTTGAGNQNGGTGDAVTQ